MSICNRRIDVIFTQTFLRKCQQVHTSSLIVRTFTSLLYIPGNFHIGYVRLIFQNISTLPSHSISYLSNYDQLNQYPFGEKTTQKKLCYIIKNQELSQDIVNASSIQITTKSQIFITIEHVIYKFNLNLKHQNGRCDKINYTTNTITS